MMTISERYRLLVDEVAVFSRKLAAGHEGEAGKPQRLLDAATEGLGEFHEQVGEIPRIQLENKLTPVLLKSHSQLDRARLLLEEQGEADQAAQVWELEQQIYRLLNEL